MGGWEFDPDVPLRHTRAPPAVADAASAAGDLLVAERDRPPSGPEAPSQGGPGASQGTAVPAGEAEPWSVPDPLARERTDAVMEAVGHLASGVAHDFNNVLAVIASFADLVERRVKADPTAAGWVGSIRGATERGAALTRQLLYLVPREGAPDASLDLAAAVRDLGEVLARTLGDKVELATDVRPDVQRVRLTRPQLDEALTNLAVRARHAMPQGGRFVVEAWNEEVGPEGAGRGPAPGNYVRVRVSDTGPGMSPEAAAHVFEPFYPTKETGRGAGLGLAVVYGIVAHAGGLATVSSAPGRGTAFDLLLPAAEPAAAAVPPPDAERFAAGAHDRVLLVEDEPMIRQVAIAILEEKGYRVQGADAGPTALALLKRTGPPDVLVTDVLMPGMTGVDLAREMERRWPGMPVVFVSGYPAGNLKGYREGDPRVRFVAKPFDSATLLAAVGAALTAARAAAKAPAT